MIKLRELKSRKAKFGFEYGVLKINDVINLADFLKELYNTFADDKYLVEHQGYNSQASLKFYTDDEDVAVWIRQHSTQNF
jgi:hypothetical protein